MKGKLKEKDSLGATGIKERARRKRGNATPISA